MKYPAEPQRLPIEKINWEKLISRMGQANRSLAYYDGILQGIPNPKLLLSPLTTQEAVLSSKIEGTQATLGDVLKYEAGEEPKQEEKRRDIQEIINYRKALNTAEQELKKKPFGLNLLKQLHFILLDSVRGRNKMPGQFRKTQNWIGKPGAPIEQASFIPPAPIHLQSSLDNWEKYYHSDTADALVQLAFIHAQFEIIHPFNDGNGRLGRILIPLFLYEKNILSKPMFYLSAFFEKHNDEYIQRLRALSDDEPQWNEWLDFFLLAVDQQAKENASKAKAVLSLYESLKERFIEITHSQFAVPLLDSIFKHPIFQSTSLEKQRGLPSKPMIMQMLRQLKKAGLLKTLNEGAGRRAQVLALQELINLCEGRKIV